MEGPRELEYQVQWSLGDTTWKPQANCNKLTALTRYLELHGVKSYVKLGDGQSPVMARLCDITSYHEIRHKCDTLLKHCNFTTTTPFLAILFVSKISFNVYHVLY